MMQKQNQFTFTIVIHPPFVDQEKQEEQFYPSIGYNFATGNVEPGWAFISKDQPPCVPYFSSYVQKQNGAEFLITGGAYNENNHIQSSAFCFRIQLHDHMEGHRIKYELWRQGLTREDEDGNEIEAEKVSVIPQMNDARHNHKVFELLKPGTTNQYLYLVVGGQFIIQDEWGFLNSCEIYDEKGPVNQNGEQQWEIVEPMIQARAGFSGFVLNNKVYVYGGFTFENEETKILHSNKVECFDITTRKWKDFKYRQGLNITNHLGSSCMPISEKHILIFGGSNGEKVTDNIAIMDVEKGSIENLKSKTKLSVPRAGSQIFYLQEFKLADSAQKRDLIVVLGGNQEELSFDYFAIKNKNAFEIEYVGKNEFNNAFTGAVTGTYAFGGINDIRAWVKTMQYMPVVTLIQ
ncbi:unnamed protein product [Paramecium sonneborni]|uniref:Kelch motif family protein n=1 Tax=Paramecium sonneborni TaxID=65129 RepID=A0A8S1LJ57_9CILI|nr:unnamed protein product [Paramecium sonneborni]